MAQHHTTHTKPSAFHFNKNAAAECSGGGPRPRHGDALPEEEIMKAALAQDDADMQADVGTCYWYGVGGFPQDDAKAAAL